MNTPSPHTDPNRWVSEHGATLYAYAMSRLKNADAAEDAVQETLLGALKNLNRFPPQNEVGPWLMGILKKKVVDRLRESNRKAEPVEDDDAVLKKLFDKNGHWSKSAQSADPLRLDSLEQAEFLGLLKQCLAGLPPQQAAVFVGRELNEQNSEDLCNELRISSTNLWVLMHRARLRLAECLRARWALGDA